MSHFSRIKTQIVEKTFLIEALQDLGFTVEEGDLKVNGFGGQRMSVELIASRRFSYPIGFRKNNDTYEIIADWYGVRGVRSNEFKNQLMRRYAYLATRAKLEAQGFTLVSEQVEEKGQIRLVLRRMA